MANSQKPCAYAQNEKSHAAADSKDDKIVNFDEYRKRIDDLRWTQMTAGERIFDAFVNTPYNMALYVRRGLSEGWQLMTKGPDPKNGTAYVDSLGGGIFLDRAAAEADNTYALKHGLSKKFQEKAVRLSREAFDACRDFSVIKKTGQLRPLYPA
ncbi:MAG: hypothetical protein Q8K65_05745 [Alphaproteobacteria bacterium]|nr:hypothetical protein [Alphaproteobacteria bacterium]